MNKELVVEYLYDLFCFGVARRISPEQYLPGLFDEPEFASMLDGTPFDEQALRELIAKNKARKVLDIDCNQIRYLAFLIAEFIDRTTIPVQRLRQYINARVVLVNFVRFHSTDIEDVIFSLLVSHNEKYKLRKADKVSFSDEDKVLQNFLRLFPIKRFEKLERRYDGRLGMRLYVGANEVLLFAEALDEYLEDDYFVNRYSVGNRLYVFTKEPSLASPSRYKGAVHVLAILDDSIIYQEPGGIAHYFHYSN